MRNFILLLVLSAFSQAFAQESLEIKLNDSSSLKLTRLNIDVKIVGNYASTTYDMQFYNDFDRTLEGELVFPLAQGQSVSRFAMDVNGQLREAAIVEKELARVAFESTVRQQIDPGLLEKTEGNNYRARVYPILPKKHKRLVIGFEQELGSVSGHSVYELPLGLKESLASFSIAMKVFGVNALPKIISDGYADLLFAKKQHAFVAAISEKNHRPTTPILVHLPQSNSDESALTYSEYFYVNQALTPHTRLKKKPKKIALLWDSSYSLRGRNIGKELALLNDYLAYLSDVEVHYLAFSNAIQQKTTFSIQNGDWSALKRTLEQAIYDGGTAMGLFHSLRPKVDEVLLFSDGLANLGDFDMATKKPIYTINSLSSANHESLAQIATVSGGGYLNLLRLPVSQALSTLKHETFQFLGAAHDRAVYEVYPKHKTPVSNNFSVSGKFSENTTIELRFGYGGKVTQRIKVPIKKAKGTEIVKRLWAKKKLRHLNRDTKRNKEQIITHAKNHYLISDYTSMLILDRIEDYIRYRIEPPQELKAQYKKRVKELELAETDRQEELKDRKTGLFDDYESLLDWYNTRYPLKKAEQNQLKTVEQTNRDTTEAPTNTSNAVANTLSTNRPYSARIAINIDSSRNYVSGTVIDSDAIPLPGANVLVKGTTNGTTTDFDGNFAINAEEGDELVFSYIGFESAEIVIGTADRIAVSLEQDAAHLEEVVVVGYGVQRETRSLSYSVTTTVSESLQGRAAGVQITQGSGELGSGSRVVVRGLSSFSGTSNPLYIVDGQIVSGNPMQELKLDDIGEIQVLKALSATALYGARAANGVIIVNTKQGLDTKQEAIEALNMELADKIALKSWNPETPYVKILAEEPTAELAYAKYLEIRDDYSNSPAFYLDVSDFFEKKEKYDAALTILTNLMEVELNNHEIMKALAYKLEYFKEYDLAVVVYEKVLELRPEEPQSYRDLALAYELTGEIQKSYSLLYRLYSGDLLHKDEDERFYGIEEIAFVELTRLVSLYGKELQMTKSEIEKFKALPVDVRVVIDWNHNDTDIDLWVEDPQDEKAYYKNQETDIGGRMSQDMTEGYGPEEFMLKNAMKGEYKVLIDYYADDIQKISGPTILKVTLFTNYGRSNEARKTLIVRLDKEEDELEVGRLRF